MIDYKLRKTNRVTVLVGILVVSLLGNFYFITKINNYGKRMELIGGNHYMGYFSVLSDYSNSLDYFANNESQVFVARERELEALYVHSFNLVEHARTYAMSSDSENELSDLTWNFALYIQDITNNLNEVDINNSSDKLKELSKAIMEIVKLENQTRGEILKNNKGFVEKEMYNVLKPVVEKAMDLYSNE